MWQDRAVISSDGEAFGGAQGTPLAKYSPRPEIPDYLTQHYNWAYVTPEAVQRFERPWLINLIVWGNYARLTAAVLDRLRKAPEVRNVLQVACAYGDFTPALAREVGGRGGRLDVIDVLPVQLENLSGKLAPSAPVALHRMDSAALDFSSESYDAVVMFLLLHEQPDAWKRRTLSEAWRVTRPGGRIILVDYARPAWWNPVGYVLAPALALLEPFALDMWRRGVESFAPPQMLKRGFERSTLFGGLYQIVTFVKD